jgi:hypothetical protein
MALPQQVVEQLSHGSARTPGWSSGILLFSGSIFLIIVFIYAGLRFGYEPYLNSQLSSLEAQAQKVGQSVSPADEANLITFYSQIANLQLLIKNHVFFSQFLTWLGQNTEANVYYTSMIFSSSNQIALAGVAKTSADVLEQIAIFEAAPNAAAVSLSNVTFSSSLNGWVFDVVLTMQPSVFMWTSGASAPASVSASVGTFPATTPAVLAPGSASTTTP